MMLQKHVESTADPIVRCRVQREQDYGRALGHGGHLWYDRLRPVFQEVVEERIDEQQIAFPGCADNRDDCVIAVVAIVAARLGTDPGESFVQHPQPARSQAIPARWTRIAAEYSNVTTASGFGRAPNHEPAAVVATVVDVRLCRAQPACGQGPHASCDLDYGVSPRLAAERIHEAERYTELALPARELGQDTMLEQIAGIAHVVRQRHSDWPPGLQTEDPRRIAVARIQVALELATSSCVRAVRVSASSRANASRVRNGVQSVIRSARR